MKYTLIAIAFLVMSVGCSSAPTTNCQEPDWYELGRQSGAQGQKATPEGQTQARCLDSDVKKLQNLYSNGYNAGLAVFCAVDNAFLLGRTGKGFYDVCPGTMALPFQRAYERGQFVLKLERDQRELSQKMNSLQVRLNKGGLDDLEKEKLSLEKSSLEKRLATNEKELSRLRQFN